MRYGVTFAQKYLYEEHLFIPGVSDLSFMSVEVLGDDNEMTLRHILRSVINNQYSFFYPWDEFQEQIPAYGLKALPYSIVPTSCHCGHDYVWLHKPEEDRAERMLGCIFCYGLRYHIHQMEVKNQSV